MPLYRYIDAPEGLADATYLFDTNPDAERFEEAEEFATGGVITEPVIAIVGESGPEAIVPTDTPESTEAAETGATEENA